MENVCRIFDLGCKEVINVADGARLGYVNDVEVNMGTGRVHSFIIPGRLKLFGLLGREDDFILPWDSIEKVGEDIILVRIERPILKRSHPPKWASR